MLLLATHQLLLRKNLMSYKPLFVHHFLSYILYLINPLLSEELELNLVELAVFVSEANNKNILVDESLRGENIVFIVNDKQDFFLEAFEKALNLKGLELIKNEKFYFVKKPDDFLEIEKYRTIKLNFVKFEDIQNQKKKYENIIIANERIDEKWISENFIINNIAAKVPLFIHLSVDKTILLRLFLIFTYIKYDYKT